MSESAIRGEGYGRKGDDHLWYGVTPQDNSKRTFYTCHDCGEGFVHFYDDQPDIFAAMDELEVSRECESL